MLEFDPQTAHDCAAALTSAIQQLVNVQTIAAPPAAGALTLLPSTFGRTPGAAGVDLGAAFERLGESLAGTLGKHVTIMTQLTNTFVTAGKAYQATDGNSAVSFSDITIPTTQNYTTLGPNGSSSNPYDGFAARYGNPADPAAPTYPAGAVPPPARRMGTDGPVLEVPEPKSFGAVATAPATLTITPPDTMHYPDFYQLGQTINTAFNTEPIDMWAHLAGMVDTTLTSLVGQLGKAMTGWSGDGATAAAQAVSDYVAEARDLPVAMHAIHDNLAFTMRWLQQTKDSMPPTAEPAYLNSTEYQNFPELFPADPAKEYKQYYNAYYVYGLNESNANLPALPQPTVSVPGAAPLPPALPPSGDQPTVQQGLEQLGTVLAGATGTAHGSISGEVSALPPVDSAIIAHEQARRVTTPVDGAIIVGQETARRVPRSGSGS